LSAILRQSNDLQSLPEAQEVLDVLVQQHPESVDARASHLMLSCEIKAKTFL
jgi:hypothetical protein